MTLQLSFDSSHTYITHTSPPLPLFGQHTLWSHNWYFLTENTLANWPIVFFLGTGATFSRWQGTYVAWPLTGTARAPSLGFPWPNPPLIKFKFSHNSLCLGQLDFLLSHAAWTIASFQKGLLPSQFSITVNMSSMTDCKAVCNFQTFIWGSIFCQTFLSLVSANHPKVFY